MKKPIFVAAAIVFVLAACGKTPPVPPALPNPEHVVFGEGGFSFAPDETARPGHEFEAIPVRAELLRSSVDATRYDFPCDLNADARVQLRIWFVSVRGTTVDRRIALADGAGCSAGFKTSEVVAVGGGGSSLSGGRRMTTWDETKHFFLAETDARLYDVSYALFDIVYPSKLVSPATPTVTLNCYVNCAGATALPCPLRITMNNPNIFIPRASETARPGVGEYADRDIIPIRGEFVNSTADLKPFAFPSGEEVSVTHGFRMWFVLRKGLTFNGPGIYVNLLNSGEYCLGSKRAEVEAILGAGSQIGAGSNNVAGSIRSVRASFASQADNDMYDIYYTLWAVPASIRCKVAAREGRYTVPFCIAPRSDTCANGSTLNGNDIPAGKMVATCPVTVDVKAGSGGSGYSTAFTDSDFNGCTTTTYTFTLRNLAMAVDLPARRAATPAPFLIWVTGGGWKGGSVEAFVNQSRYLATRGIAGIRVVYTMVDAGGNFQMGIDEMQAAYDFAVAHAAEWGLDVDRFGYVGGSAGNTIASYRAMTIPACKLFIGCNGLYDLLGRAAPNDWPYSDATSMRYISSCSTAEQLASFSAINNIPAAPPAVALFHGTGDNTISYLQSQRFAEAVKARGGRAELYLYEGLRHGFFNPGSSGAFDDVTIRINRFARSVLLGE